MPKGIWDHDLWGAIYDVDDTKVKAVLISMYRLILDMRESDVLAQKIADKVSRRERVTLSLGGKALTLLLTVLLILDTVLQIKHGG